ncbi:MAG: glycoside hydrolase family 15 protein [Homoserinimonas sp.]
MSETTGLLGQAEREQFAELAQASVRLILGLQDASGAYPASPVFSAYRGYCWFRDGSFIADGMSAAGAVDSASLFFDWCSGILISRREQVVRIARRAAEGDPVPDLEMLPTRFTFDGGDGADDWWDFQLDGYGTWLWAVAEHSARHGVDLERWRDAIALTVDYLLSSWDRPCFDWWEENPTQVHVSTLGCIAAGLRAVADSGILDSAQSARAADSARDAQQLILDRGQSNGHLVKWLGASTVDASLIAVLYPLEVIAPTSELGLSTIAAVDAQLNAAGGVHRYLDDTFYGGGQWPLLSCLLGLAFSASGRTAQATEQLQWAASTVDEAGDMPEQVGLHLLDHTMTAEWVERWGPVASPLLWTHAMYVRLAVELGIVERSAR